MNPVVELGARVALWWADHRPFSKEAMARRKAKRAARKAARNGPQPDIGAGEFFQPEGVRSMGLILELLGSAARTSLPMAVTYLDSLGIHITGDATTTVAAAIGLWVVMQVWSFVRKIRNKPRSVE